MKTKSKNSINVTIIIPAIDFPIFHVIHKLWIKI